MHDTGIDADQQIDRIEHRHRIIEIVDFGTQADQRRTAEITRCLRVPRSLLQRHQRHAGNSCQRPETRQVHAAAAVVGMGRAACPDQPDAQVIRRQQSVETTTPMLGALGLGPQIRELRRNVVEPCAGEHWQAAERGKRIAWRSLVPMRHEVPQLRKLPEDWPHFAGTAERQVGTALRGPRDVAGELDDVAASLVGEQQQLAVRHRRAVPATHVVWRDAAGGSGQAQPPFVFAPPLGELTTEQQCRGSCEMR